MRREHYLALAHVVLLVHLCIIAVHGINIIRSGVITASSITSPNICVV